MFDRGARKEGILQISDDFERQIYNTFDRVMKRKKRRRKSPNNNYKYITKTKERPLITFSSRESGEFSKPRKKEKEGRKKIWISPRIQEGMKIAHAPSH